MQTFTQIIMKTIIHYVFVLQLDKLIPKKFLGNSSRLESLDITAILFSSCNPISLSCNANAVEFTRTIWLARSPLWSLADTVHTKVLQRCDSQHWTAACEWRVINWKCPCVSDEVFTVQRGSESRSGALLTASTHRWYHWYMEHDCRGNGCIYYCGVCDRGKAVFTGLQLLSVGIAVSHWRCSVKPAVLLCTYIGRLREANDYSASHDKNWEITTLPLFLLL